MCGTTRRTLGGRPDETMLKLLSDPRDVYGSETSILYSRVV